MESGWSCQVEGFGFSDVVYYQYVLVVLVLTHLKHKAMKAYGGLEVNLHEFLEVSGHIKDVTLRK